jgi:hypothetical protein
VTPKLQQWFALIEARLAREVGSTFDCRIAFAVGDELFTLALDGARIAIAPGLDPAAAATLVLAPAFIGAVLGAREDIDFRRCDHLVRMHVHERRASRQVFMLGHLCNATRPFRRAISSAAEARVATHGMPTTIESVPWTDAVVDEHIAWSRPVVLRGAIDDWPARRWTQQTLAARRVTIGPYSCRRLFGATPEVPPAYVSGLAVNPAFAPALGALPFLTGRMHEPYVFAGQAGGITHLHRDFVNGFLVQIVGRKQFRFYPPSVSTEVHAMQSFARSQHCWANVFAPDLERHPALATLRPLEVTLHPGEVLFIPVGWYHAARAEDATFSLGTFIHIDKPAAPAGTDAT